jgi:hypothetical protein
LAVCPDFFASRMEVDKILQACGNYERMQWYYENRAGKACYIPWNGANYTADNLSYLQNNMGNAPAENSAEVTLSINTFLYTGAQQINNRTGTIRRGFPLKGGTRKIDWVRKNFTGTPFDRDFIVVQVKESPAANAQQSNEPSVSTSNLGEIILFPGPDQKSRQLIERIGNYLASYRSSKVILEAEYSSASQQKDLQQKITSIRNMLYKSGANTKQVESKLISASAQQQNQANRNAISQRTVVRVLGVNFPEDFSNPSKRY